MPASAPSPFLLQSARGGVALALSLNRHIRLGPERQNAGVVAGRVALEAELDLLALEPAQQFLLNLVRDCAAAALEDAHEFEDDSRA